MQSSIIANHRSESFPQSLSSLINVYAIYRLSVSMVLWILFLTATNVGNTNPLLFLLAGSAYLISNLLLVLQDRVTWVPTDNKIFLIAFSDFILLQLIGRSSGAYDSGMSVLLLVSVASGSIFITKHGLLLPALATLTILLYAVWDLLNHRIGSNQLVSSAWLSLSFFLINIFIGYLTRKLHESEATAKIENQIAIRLENINSLIIERMQTGVVVCSKNGEVISCNSAAQQVFEFEDLAAFKNEPLLLKDIDTALGEILDEYTTHTAISAITKTPEMGPLTMSRQIEILPSRKLVKVSAIQISENTDSELLIFVEDMAKIAQQAQQLKLSSLGTLTASIAHEIRNPVGAISHAAQLLSSDLENKQSIKLAKIIHQQAKRCSNIIESITSVSQGKAAKPSVFLFDEWLANFISRYQNSTHHSILIDVEPNLIISFDKAHLEQVLTNLLDNAIKASLENTAMPSIVTLAYSDTHQKPIIEIIDQGMGISPKNAQRLFEPFFTTGKEGSGLGLYICRELCRANQTTISYLPQQRYGDGYADHCFRLHLPHPDRQALPLDNLSMH